MPGVDGEFDLLNRPGLRLDSGFVTGDEVSTYYDAMLAKVIAWAPTREQAARRLAAALAGARIHGLVTNRDLLVEILRDEAFLAGDVGTHFLADRPTPPPADDAGAGLAATYVAVRDGARRAAPCSGASRPAGATCASAPSVTTWRDGDTERHVRWTGGRDGVGFAEADAEVLAEGPDWVRLRVGKDVTTYRVALAADGTVADVDSPRGHVRLDPGARFTDPADAVASGSLLAPMPGTVVCVAVEAGAAVAAGQPVLVLEAMKMQHTVSAPYAGTVTAISVAAGVQVAAGEVLAVVEGTDRRSRHDRPDRVHRDRGAPRAARAGGQAGREVRPRVVHREGPRRREDHRAVAGDRRNGYLGINVPEEYGGGGGGIGDVAAVCEELAAQGCPLLLMVVSPAICGTVIARYGTEAQKRRWLPGICDGTGTMAFAITEPDAGTNTHNITTTARRDGDGWVLTGQKIWISGVDEADHVLVVARTEDARTGKLKPCLFVVPTDAEGFEFTAIPMEIISPENQFQVFLDGVRLPADALVGDENGGLVQLSPG